jgi:hypothetical protein
MLEAIAFARRHVREVGGAQLSVYRVEEVGV